MYHLGDPCIHCGIPHDDVESGFCAKAVGISATMRTIYYLAELLAEHEKESAAKTARLKGQIAEQRTIVARTEAGLDLEKVKLAETIMFASDYSKGGDEKGSARADAVKWFATGKSVTGNWYGDLRNQAFGTKNYDRWSGQRCDCEYGSGPSHGYICFQIGLKQDARKRYLTDGEREAAVYYLVNLERIQSSRVKA